VSSELAIKLVSFDVIATLRSRGDLRSEFTDSPFEDDLRRVR
jgi:hypothetical protein